MRFQGQFVASVTMALACLAAGAQTRFTSHGPQGAIGTTREVHIMPPEAAARAYPVHLHAVVTYYDPYSAAPNASIFVDDATGGIYVSAPTWPILPIQAGTVVDIAGVTDPGAFAASVNATSIRVIGQSHLPAAPHKTTLTLLRTGALDCQWVEVEGRVRSVHRRPYTVALKIATGDGTFDAVTPRRDGVDYEALVDSLIRLRGNAGAVFNERRQMVGVRLFFPTLREVSVITAAPRDPFATPVVLVSQLFRYSPNPGLLHRVHVQGEVTLDWPGRVLCIQSAQGGICMQTTQAARAPVGSFVDVVGFPAIDLYKPTLEDAVFRVSGTPGASPAPVPITAERALEADLDGKLVRIDAELIGQDIAAAEPTLMLRAGGMLFPAILPKGATLGTKLPWKEGSIMRITGVCNTQIDALNANMSDGVMRAESVHILLRSMGDVAVLRAPTWWTARHTLESFSVIALLVLVSFAWIVVLKHRVARQTQALRGSEERLRHLSEHDALTGLPNRILLSDRLQTSLKRAARFQSCLGLLMVDADEFKIVNDALGHKAGDKVLCELASRLRACVRTTDTVARIGGDEFIVLLPDLRIAAEAESVAAKIVAAVASPYEVDHAHVIITVSVGIATYPETSGDLETLIQYADEAMYTAKEKGKNRFQVHSSKPAGSGGRDLLRLNAQVHLPTGGA